MTTSYTLNIRTKTETLGFLVAYRNGTFKKLEHKKGIFSNNNQWRCLMMVIPDLEKHIETINKKYNGRVSFTKASREKTPSLYKGFMADYFSFYENQNSTKPKISGKEGMAMKNIISHLKDLCLDDTECRASWQLILSNWNTLDSFCQKQTSLKQIHTNINTIIKQIK